MFERLQALLGHRNPRFGCRAAGGTERGAHTVFIDHETTPPLDERTLADMVTQLGDLPELFAFYRRFGSLRLYRDTLTQPAIGQASAYFIAPPDAWAELRQGVDDWLDGIDEEELAEFAPDWLHDCIAFGEIPNSGNTFLLPLQGPDRGKVFEFEHDGLEFLERAPGFEAFVERLALPDEDLLRDIGGHTRYTDGRTPLQWMPESYRHD